MRDTGGKLGAPRAVCAFLAGAAANIVATVCMVAYSEALTAILGSAKFEVVKAEEESA